MKLLQSGFGELSRFSRSHSLRLSRRRRNEREGRQKRTVAKGRADLEPSLHSTHSSHGEPNETSDTEPDLETGESSETYLVDFQDNGLESQESAAGESESPLQINKSATERQCEEDQGQISNHRQQGVAIRLGSDTTSATSSLTVRRYPERADILRLPSLDQSRFDDILVPVRALWSERTQSHSASPSSTLRGSASLAHTSRSTRGSHSYSIEGHNSVASIPRTHSQESHLLDQKNGSETCSSYHTATQINPFQDSTSQISIHSGNLIVKSTYCSTSEKTYAEERLLRNLRQLGGSSSSSNRIQPREATHGARGDNRAQVETPKAPLKASLGCAEDLVWSLHAMVTKHLRLNDSTSGSEECHPPVSHIPARPIKPQWRNEHKNYFPPGSRNLPQDFVVRICNEYRKEIEETHVGIGAIEGKRSQRLLLSYSSSVVSSER